MLIQNVSVSFLLAFLADHCIYVEQTWKLMKMPNKTVQLSLAAIKNYSSSKPGQKMKWLTSLQAQIVVSGLVLMIRLGYKISFHELYSLQRKPIRHRHSKLA